MEQGQIENKCSSCRGCYGRGHVQSETQAQSPERVSTKQWLRVAPHGSFPILLPFLIAVWPLLVASGALTVRMAEAIGIASGLVGLATLAVNSAKVLYRTIESFRSNQKAIRELKEELESLDGVLQSLCQTIESCGEELTALKSPLRRCGEACVEFETVIAKCTAHSGGSRQSFRDWAKIRYMGEDITGFKNMLAGYKATISIALGDANFRTANVTVEVLKQYKEMVANTTSDLNDHLQEMEIKLQNVSVHVTGMRHEDLAEEILMRDERDSTQQCLRICAQVSEHLEQVQPKVFEHTRTLSDARSVAIDTLGKYLSALRATGNTVKECKDNLDVTILELSQHLKGIEAKLRNTSWVSNMSAEKLAERERMHQERQSTEQCLRICAQAAQVADQARTNVVEDMSAANDSHQVAVATLGDLISAKRITAGDRSRQWVGQMSDASLQQLSRDDGHSATNNSAAQRRKMLTGPEDETAKEFKGRYGSGKPLSSSPVA